MPLPLDDLDIAIFEKYGMVMHQIQVFELFLGGVQESQAGLAGRPWEEREAAFHRWLKMSAGQVAHELDLPEQVASDVKWLIQARNHYAHMWLVTYAASRGAVERDEQPDLSGLRRRKMGVLLRASMIFNQANARLSEICNAIVAGSVDVATLTGIWEGSEPVIPEIGLAERDDWDAEMRFLND